MGERLAFLYIYIWMTLGIFFGAIVSLTETHRYVYIIILLFKNVYIYMHVVISIFLWEWLHFCCVAAYYIPPNLVEMCGFLMPIVNIIMDQPMGQ